MRRLLHIIFCLTVLWSAVSCVHEFPDPSPDPVSFDLHLDFSTDLPLYKEIEYVKSDGSKSPEETHDVRYVVNAYRIDGKSGHSRIPDETFVFTVPYSSSLDYTAHLTLPEGIYEFCVWTDYADVGSVSDKYYNTTDFSEIILSDRDCHSGSNDCRDAFRGRTEAAVVNPAYYTGSMLESIDNQATVKMLRPMGKFKFISTDVELFLTRVQQLMSQKGSKASIDEFKVVFRYNAYMPCSYNMFTDKPADSWTGMTFDSRLIYENKDELVLGFDYVFVNGATTTLSISAEVYDMDGNMISSTRPVDVPIVRSRLTLVKGEFLTSKASGGVNINPDYAGDDYNIEIK